MQRKQIDQFIEYFYFVFRRLEEEEEADDDKDVLDTEHMQAAAQLAQQV